MTLCSYLVLDSLDDLLLVQLENLYDVELRLTAAWNGLAEATVSNSLRAVFEENVYAAMMHVNMLEQVAEVMGLDFHRKHCETIQCLVSQAEELPAAAGESEVKNAAFVVVARRIHHYKIAAYTSIRNLVQRSGRQDLVRRFHQAVESETQALERLTEVGEIPSHRDAACSAA